MNSKNIGTSISGLLLMTAVLCQLALIIVNLLEVTDQFNYWMFINNYIIGFLIILHLTIRGLSTHFLAFAFFGCFMLFLMGQKPFEPEYDVYLTFTRVKLNSNQYFLFSCILFLGLVCTFYSYIYWSRRRQKEDIDVLETIEISSASNNALKPILTIMLWATLPCALYMQTKIVLVRGGMAYTSGYLINVNVPAIVKVGYYIYSTVILLYLALKPTKKQLVIALGTFILIEGGLQLFQGRRALFASTVLFTIWYLIKYSNIVKIERKNLVRIGLVLISMVVLFYIVEQTRDASSTKLSLQFFRRFLVSTGGSDSVIANTIFRKNDFPENGIVYLFDPFINNPIGNFLTGKTASAQGLSYIQQHHSFSHWISYMTDASLYLSGHGMGSSYLAEVFLAFGIVGVIGISMIIGWLLNKFNDIQFDQNIYVIGVVFFFVRRLFTLPRDGLFSWTGGLVYLIFTYLILYPFYCEYCKRQYKLREIALKDETGIKIQNAI